MEQNHLNLTGAHSGRTLRSTLLGSVLLAALGLSQSYGCDPPPPQPLLASFGASATDITEGQVLRVTAVMSATSPVWTDSVRAVLTDPTGTLLYSTFAQTTPGTFSVELTWAQLHQLKQLAFASEEARVFRADFIDATGTKVSHSFTVRLHCNGNPACEGRCVVQGAACPVTTQQQCYGGRCASSGCIIDAAGYLSGEPNPANSCQSCQPLVAKTSFSSGTPYVSCATGLTCSAGGKCEVPFAKIDSAQNSPSVTWVAAPDAATRYAYDSSTSTLYRRLGGVKAPDAAMPASVIAMQSPSPSVVYLLTSTSLSRSTDSGATYITNALPSGTYSAMWAASSQEIFLGTPGSRIYRSTNQGTSFMILINSLGGGAVNAIWGRSPSKIYFGTSSGLFQTLDGGMTYAQLTTFPSAAAITGVWGTGTSEVYATTRDGIFHSGDDGVTWNLLNIPATAKSQTLNFTSVHGCSATDVYFVNAGASAAELWHTTDGKTTKLVPVGNAPTFAGVRAVACTAPGKVFLGGSFDANVGLLESL